ncbi:hypothetical protein ZIOFF_069564 [Zingiber officinale]|uniref:Bulb-type lectin domain-containing protein n=1 Tax=Zingiber officinale TaxID=94328 RepID=A0A8J5C409_ZINOF|nr:hypothetical protein ZIOFF_069564 [Zingiber officinale]
MSSSSPPSRLDRQPCRPVSSSSTLSLTASGLALSFVNRSPAWSTTRLSAAAAALQLLPSGELRLLDAANASLWSSFDYPTDTLLPNQLLPVSSQLLTSAVDENDPAPVTTASSSHAVL